MILYTCWCRVSYAKLVRCLCMLRKTFQEDGPFDGIVGFSQGGCLAGLLAAMQPRSKAAQMRVTNIDMSTLGELYHSNWWTLPPSGGAIKSLCCICKDFRCWDALDCMCLYLGAIMCHPGFMVNRKLAVSWFHIAKANFALCIFCTLELVPALTARFNFCVAPSGWEGYWGVSGGQCVSAEVLISGFYCRDVELCKLQLEAVPERHQQEGLNGSDWAMSDLA